MLVAKILNPAPVDYRSAFPTVSFPASGPTDEFLAEQGYAKVNVFRDHDRATQKLVPCAPVYEAPWIYTVAVEAKTQEDLDADTAAQAAKVRADRDRRLAECDWVTLKAIDASNDGLGIQLPQVWMTYRQALRDITAQAGFPWNVTWPDAP